MQQDANRKAYCRDSARAPGRGVAGATVRLGRNRRSRCRLSILSHLPDESINRQSIIDLDQYQAVIWVSANAARLSLELIDQYWPQPPVGVNWLAVGPATAEVLAGGGIQAQTPQASNSEALLQLPALQQVAAQKLLVVKGEGGRELLIDTLKAHGATVDLLDLYRRTIRPYSQSELATCLGDQTPDAILATSRDILLGMESLLAKPLPDLHQVPIVVASERIAAAAVDCGFQRVVTATGADDSAMLGALDELFGAAGDSESDFK